jgi:hypothetical protein
MYIYIHSPGKTIASEGPEVTQLRIDITAVQECFRSACNHKDLANYADAVGGHFRPLHHALSLISDPKSSKEFDKTLKSILKVAGGHAEDADALASFALCCVQLRYDTKQSIFKTAPKNTEGEPPMSGKKTVLSTKKTDISPIKTFFGFGKKDKDDNTKLNSDKEDKLPLSIQTDDSMISSERQESPKPLSSSVSIECSRESRISEFIGEIRAQSDSTPGKGKDDHIYRYIYVYMYVYVCVYVRERKIIELNKYIYICVHINMYTCI